MLNTVYEKPKMEFVNVQNENKIANTCWGYHGTDTLLYCDIPGKGYLSFQIGNKKCSLDLINVMYYDNEGNSSLATADQIATLTEILISSGGESGNPYKGEGSTIIPDHPGDWS